MVLFSQFLTPASEVLSWINYSTAIPHLWFPRVNKVLRFYFESSIFPFASVHAVFECPLKQNDNYIMTITRLTWILRYHWIYNILILELYKYEKMHVKVSEIRNITLNILLYPFVYSAKEVKISVVMELTF